MTDKIFSRFTVIDRRLTPPDDPVFQYLMQQAVYGFIPVYGAIIEPNRFRRFDPAFRPELEPTGDAAVQDIMRRWNAGEKFQMWVYPDENDLVVSDDYLTLAAIERGKPQTVAVQIIGTPYGKGIIDTTGPLELQLVKSMIMGTAAP